MHSFNQSTAPDTAQQYLTFTLGDEIFAVGTRNVREIIEYGHLTPVPLMPSSILGVINLRGGVVPIMDLRQRFGEGQTCIGRRTCIIILEVVSDEVQQIIGIVVEAVNAVLEVPLQDIDPPPGFGGQVRTDFLLGIAKVDDKLVVILDIGRVLSLDDMRLLATADNLSESA